MTEEQFFYEQMQSDTEPKKMKRETFPTVQVFSAGLSKKEIRDLANETVTGFLEGNGNILKVAEALSAMEAYVKEIKDNPEYKDLVITEIEKFGKSVATSSGAKIELAEVGTKYDYSSCGDVEWERLDSDLRTIKERMKERETFLKNIPSVGIEQLNKDTGEMVTVYPPAKTSTSSFKITLKN